jgi:hypothetical protein
MTRKSLIPIMASSAVALATTLWAGSASADDYWAGIFHDWENQNLCMNNPYQSGNDDTELVANGNCGGRDPGSRIYVMLQNDYVYGKWQGFHLRLTFQTNDFGTPERCIDNHFGEQWDGNHIVIWHCNDGDAQKWDWDGTSFRYHANPDYCISVNSDGRLVLWHCIGQGNQKFVITDVEKFYGGLSGEDPRKGDRHGNGHGRACEYEHGLEMPVCPD